jgi:hypothetical protein
MRVEWALARLHATFKRSREAVGRSRSLRRQAAFISRKLAETMARIDPTYYPCPKCYRKGTLLEFASAARQVPHYHCRRCGHLWTDETRAPGVKHGLRAQNIADRSGEGINDAGLIQPTPPDLARPLR